jgi:replicative DNA helicase
MTFETTDPYAMRDAYPQEGNLPPQSLTVEMAVLGAMMISPEETVSNALSMLTTEAFYKSAHRIIFDSITALYQRHDPVDLISVAEELRRRDKLEEIGTMFYLNKLTEEVISPAHIEYHCRIILEKALKRQLIESNIEITQECYKDTTDAFVVLDAAETRLFKLSEQHMKKSYVPLHQLVKPLLDKVHEYRTSLEHGVTGIPSGYRELDDKTGGWQSTDLIIIAARPSMGKTALALSMARNAVVDHNIPVGIFSLEMSKEQLALRLLCAEAKVNMQQVRTGRIKESEFGELARCAGALERAELYIDDTPSITILELRAKTRRMVEEHGVRLIIVDYLQLMSAPTFRDSREREIASISRALKALAKDVNIPVIAISQLNRAVEQRKTRKPELQDLRESGSIEQDADVVMFVHRERDEEGGMMDQFKATIIIAKQRNGEIGEVSLAWVGRYARFENLERQMPPVPYLPGDQEPQF